MIYTYNYIYIYFSIADDPSQPICMPKSLLDPMNPAAAQNLQLHRRPRHPRHTRSAGPLGGAQVPQHGALQGMTLQGFHQVLLEEEICQTHLSISISSMAGTNFPHFEHQNGGSPSRTVNSEPNVWQARSDYHAVVEKMCWNGD